MRCEYISGRNQRSDFSFSYEDALRIADEIASAARIFIGSETLPHLLLRELQHRSRIDITAMPQYMYTGRIIVDLCIGYIRFEILKNNHYDVFETKLLPNETNVENLVKRLANYGIVRNVQLFQLIDLNLLTNQSSFDEIKEFETLKERYDECIAYPRSMIVYDLDALVGVHASESYSSMGLSTSFSVGKQNTYKYICARFQEAFIEQQQHDHEERLTKERWSIAIIKHPFLLKHFPSDVKFTRTKVELEEIEIERQKGETSIKCVKCKDYYIENENKMGKKIRSIISRSVLFFSSKGSCLHHDGFIYDSSAPDLTILTEQQFQDILNELQANIRKYPLARDQFEQKKTQYQWICCETTATIGSGMNGCKNREHGIEKKNKNPQYLDETVVEHWEKQRQNNLEYLAKRSKMLEKQSSAEKTVAKKSRSLKIKKWTWFIIKCLVIICGILTVIAVDWRALISGTSIDIDFPTVATFFMFYVSIKKGYYTDFSVPNVLIILPTLYGFIKVCYDAYPIPIIILFVMSFFGILVEMFPDFFYPPPNQIQVVEIRYCNILKMENDEET